MSKKNDKPGARMSGQIWDHLSTANNKPGNIGRSLQQADAQARLAQKDRTAAQQAGKAVTYDSGMRDYEIMRRRELRSTIIGRATMCKSFDRNY